MLQTENPMQIRKELILIRKFLGMEDEVPCIYDEIKRKVPIDQKTGKTKKITIAEKKLKKKMCAQKRNIRNRLGHAGELVNYELKNMV